MVRAVLCGTANAGKTTLGGYLRREGYTVIEEAETPYVQRMANLLGPDKTRDLIRENYFKFKSKVGERQLRLEESVQNDDGRLIFQDRCGISWVAYCRLRDIPVPESIKRLADASAYDIIFFLKRLPHFDERAEEGRIMNESESSLLEGLLWQEYQERGYSPVIVPTFHESEDRDVQARSEFVLGNIRTTFGQGALQLKG